MLGFFRVFLVIFQGKVLLISFLKSKYLALFFVIFSSEAIYTLPFHLPRFFRTDFLTSFHITNSELSEAQALYGIISFICYFPGGFLAQVFHPLLLISSSLFLTLCSGAFLYWYQDLFTLKILYSVWGMTTVLLFWSSMITFVRLTHSADEQGRAFGRLEFGRGLVTALFVSIINLLLADFSVGGSDKRIFVVISFYLGVILISFLGCFLLSRQKLAWQKKIEPEKRINLHSIKKVLANPGVWFNFLIILAAYSAFKGIDYYSLLMRESFELLPYQLAYFVTFLAWARPLSALFAGKIGDLLHPSKACFLCFLVVLASSLILTLEAPQRLGLPVFLTLLSVQIIGIYSLRGLYFALFEEAHVEKDDTGIASGFVSLFGFTPEIFLPIMAVSLIDGSPGVTGYQNFFLFLCVLSVLGMFAAKNLDKKKI